VVTLVTLYQRVPLKVNVIRDRGNVMHDADDPEVQNVYRLQIMNTQEVARDVGIKVSGLDGIELEGGMHPIHLDPASSRVVTVRVEAPRASGSKGTNAIRFSVTAVDPARPGAQPIEVIEKA